jgi:signal transduction histidine kinase
MGDRTLHVEAISVPVLTLGSVPRSFRTAFHDVTRRKRAEAEREAAHASEQHLRSLLEALDRAHIDAANALARPEPATLPELMDLIVRHARQITGAESASMELRQAGLRVGSVPGPRAEPGEEGPPASSAHVLAVELGYGGRVLADLKVGRAPPEPPFSRDASKALQMLAERLASSLEIARLRALEARETLRLSLLEQVAARLRQAHEVQAAERAVTEVARVLVPGFADLCAVHLARERTLELQLVTDTDPEREMSLQARLRNEQTREGLARSLAELARSPECHLLRLERSATAAVGVPFAGLTATLRCTSLIVAPLRARERLLGAICFGRVHPREDYDLALLGWAEEFAARCAQALDSALLVHELRDAVQWRDNLMAMISHDLKNPLSAISLSAISMTPEQSREERRSSSKQVELIRRSADYMHHMINDMLSVNMLDAGSFRVTLHRESAYELAEEACALAAPLLAARPLYLEKAFIKDLPYVFADRDAIQRVFSNLIGNAAKFTPRGGRVRISASYSDSKVMFCVSDNGPGIPEEQRDRLFDRYWKGRKGSTGLGLGLYISKAIVEAHEGRLWLESDEGSGATFCFELRRCDPAH